MSEDFDTKGCDHDWKNTQGVRSDDRPLPMTNLVCIKCQAKRATAEFARERMRERMKHLIANRGTDWTDYDEGGPTTDVAIGVAWRLIPSLSSGEPTAILTTIEGGFRFQRTNRLGLQWIEVGPAGQVAWGRFYKDDMSIQRGGEEIR